jgi:hypothetical protein
MSTRCTGRVDQRAGTSLMAQQLRERVERQLAQAFTLRKEPLLERRFTKRHIFEQIAAVEAHREGERIRSGLRHTTFELEDVDVDRRRVQRHAVAIEHEHGRRSAEFPER